MERETMRGEDSAEIKALVAEFNEAQRQGDYDRVNQIAGCALGNLKLARALFEDATGERSDILVEDEKDTEEAKVIRISWKSPALPARVSAYYHTKCYNACPVTLPNGEKETLKQSEVSTRAICNSCGEPFNK